MTIYTTTLGSHEMDFISRNFDVLNPLTGELSKDFSRLSGSKVIVLTCDRKNALLNRVHAKLIRLFETEPCALYIEGFDSKALDVRELKEFKRYPFVALHMFPFLKRKKMALSQDCFIKEQNLQWDVTSKKGLYYQNQEDKAKKLADLLNKLKHEGRLRIADNKICVSDDAESRVAEIISDRLAIEDLKKQIFAAEVELTHYEDDIYYENPKKNDQTPVYKYARNFIQVEEADIFENAEALSKICPSGLSSIVLTPARELAGQVYLQSSLEDEFYRMGYLQFEPYTLGKFLCFPEQMVHFSPEVQAVFSSEREYGLNLGKQDLMKMADNTSPIFILKAERIKITGISLQSARKFTECMSKLSDTKPMQLTVPSFCMFNEKDVLEFVKEELSTYNAIKQKRIESCRNSVIDRLLSLTGIGLAEFTSLHPVKAEVILYNHEWCLDITSYGNSLRMTLEKDLYKFEKNDLFEVIQSKGNFMIPMGSRLVVTDYMNDGWSGSDELDLRECLSRKATIQGEFVRVEKGILATTDLVIACVQNGKKRKNKNAAGRRSI